MSSNEMSSSSENGPQSNTASQEANQSTETTTNTSTAGIPAVQATAASLEEFSKYISQMTGAPVAAAPASTAAATAAPDQQVLWQQALQALAVGTTFVNPAPASASYTAPAAQPFVLPASVPPPAIASSAPTMQIPTLLPPAPAAGQKRPADGAADDENNSKRLASGQVSLSSGDQVLALEDLAKQHPNWGSMTPAERRRQERNLREQQRSYLISQQIKKLRDVLTESNVPFKPNKFSILVSVVDYIKSLQARSIMLDSEHQKLLDTIKGTNEMVNSGTVPEASEKDSIEAESSKATSELLMVQGLDYKAVFEHCPFAIGVASLDGRILACNYAFESLLALDSAPDNANQSFFVYIRNHQDVFDAMADLLKRSSVASETGEGVVREEHLLYWCGRIVSLKSEQVSASLIDQRVLSSPSTNALLSFAAQLLFNITLTSTSNGNPSFFGLSAALAPPIPG